MNNEVDEVGDELQKISVMKNLPALIKEDLAACIQRVIPRMQQTLPHGTTEYNIGACEAVRNVAFQNIMSAENFTKVFLQQILISLESRDTVAAEEWLNVLLDVIQVLPVNVLQSEVLPVAVSKAHISKSVAIRITSCKIMGKLALSFPPFLVKKDIIPVVISLCQDVSGEVRAVMTAELPSIGSTMGSDTANCLLNLVLDLISDEEVMVREAAIQAVAKLVSKFPPDVQKNTIIPLTKKIFSEILKNEDNLLIVLSKYYGLYAIGLKNVMAPIEKAQFLQRYIQMSQLNSNTRHKLNPYKPIVVDEEELALRLTECRLNCAYNFPAMVMFAGEHKPELVDSLYSVLKSLASDSFCQVRRKISAGFYEVMKLMPRWHPQLKTEFIKLLRDEIDIVLEGLVPNISNILVGFAGSNTITADKPEAGKDVGQALFVCEKNLSEAPRWRLHEELLLAFRAVPRVFHPEFVYIYFVPLLMTRAVNGRILPVRVAALHTLLVIIVDPSQAKQRLKLRNKILELCNNASFHCRLLFLRGMSILLTLSPEVLKELFFHNITSMAEDKVPNIRLMVCKLLPKLKSLAMEPLDRKLLASVDASIMALNGEKDRDVLEHLTMAFLQMDDFEKTKLNNKKLGPQEADLMKIRDNTTDTFPRVPTRLNNIQTIQSFHSGPSSKDRPQTNLSSYTVANQRSANTRVLQRESSISSVGTGSRAQSATDPVRAGAGSRQPAYSQPARSSIIRNTTKKGPTTNKLSSDEFLVDAGIPSGSASAVLKRIPTPRPIHRPIIGLVTETETLTEAEARENIRKSVLSSPELDRACSTLTNKNLNLSTRHSSLPIKKSYFKPLTNEEIAKELMDSDTRPYSQRMKCTKKPDRFDKKENKRLSLDPSELCRAYSRMETRSVNLNKRLSMDVDSKSGFSNRKMSCINNNFMSPKLGSTRSGIIRPQSCLLQEEKVNHSKRSMSVENLPPKVTRLGSRLPIRATDTKHTKPK